MPTVPPAPTASADPRPQGATGIGRAIGVGVRDWALTGGGHGLTAIVSTTPSRLHYESDTTYIESGPQGIVWLRIGPDVPRMCCAEDDHKAARFCLTE